MGVREAHICQTVRFFPRCGSYIKSEGPAVLASDWGRGHISIASVSGLSFAFSFILRYYSHLSLLALQSLCSLLMRNDTK